MKKKVFVHRSRRIAKWGALLRWQCSADNVEQCPDLFKALTGSRRVSYTVFISNIFWGFLFLNQINTARGLDVKMTMRDESDEEIEWTNE